MSAAVQPSTVNAFAELNEKGDRIILHFQYAQSAVLAAKAIPGYKFVNKDHGGPFWQYPLDLTTARIMREMFPSLQLGDGVKAWGKSATKQERNLRSLSGAMEAELDRLPKNYPELNEFLRGYQRADAKMQAETNLVNANQPGTGKTVATIAGILESGLENGPQLIIGPKTSLESVWLAELDRWLPEDVPVFVVHGEQPMEERLEAVAEFAGLAEEGKACWLVTNPAMIRYVDNPDYEAPPKGRGESAADYMDEKELKAARKKAKKDGINLIDEKIPAFPEIFEITYNWCVVDEYHKTGLTNNKTAMYEAVNAIQAERKALLSGTPMGGKPIKLWGALHFLEPAKFTSKWRWTDQWLEVEEEDRFGKKVKGVRPEKMDDFYEHLAVHMTRRTKAEVAPQLPAKNHMEIWYEMVPAQRKQYDAMAEAAEVKIEEEQLTATGILAEYTRLKQFANAKQRVRNLGDGKMVVSPTYESGLLPVMFEELEKLGITKNGEEDEGDEQVVIGSQSSQMIDMVTKWLTEEQGIPCVKITGAVTQKQRTEIVKEFQAEGGPRVLLITTTAGGVSITLDRASTVFILDETWDPDDQEQLEDRVHRISRIHQVNVYTFRAKDSIEEYIKKVTGNKFDTNVDILDLRRQGLRANTVEEGVAA